MNHKKTILLLFLAIVFQSFSFLSIKYASLSQGIAIFLFFFLAFFFIASRALIWQSVLKVVPLSKAYPFTSLTQVLIFIYAVVLFNETIELNNIIGLITMVIGLVFIGKSK